MATYAEVYAGVRTTIGAHAQAQDDGRVEDMAAWYVPDAVMEIPGIATLKGPEAIAEAFTQPGWRADQDHPQRHLVTNTVLTSWSDHEARATSDVTLIRHDGSTWSIVIVARYHDEFLQSDGRWLLRHRRDEYLAFQP
ncbi:nuclear transport factor 2 family protein [Streptomyces sp. NBC_01239]|uniref:nuclear transport factor 2 family protein n=1 Tax=Streptomyces sp. NBC_01239 TaxID=2903792 RepID=UPI002253F1C6|nr:nuclear transport factor 2 family protein [Streptomyces sp. NBC_01239]MCX4815255.1 nuclear transport factor 2 family protein [Streptomyces sp. NBC_01239]